MINMELGCTLLMVTHDPKTVRCTERTLYLDKGKLLEQEPSALQEGMMGHEESSGGFACQE
jgi:ABC-type lipoprotein export system ATPase subunit